MTATERTSWLESRRTGIGASDAADLIGVGWGDADRVYRSKVEPARDGTPTGVLARGLALEDIVAGLYAERMGAVLMPCDLTRHPERPWQFATPDRIRADGRRVQLKTTAGFGVDWGEPMTGEVPDGYAVQIQQEMGVTLTDSIDLAVLDVIGWEFRVYRAAFDAAFFAWLTAVEDRFWFEHVEPRRPPGPEWAEQFNVAAIAVQLQPGKVVELNGVAPELLERRERLKAIEKEAEQAVKAIDRELDVMLGDAMKGVCRGWSVPRICVKEHTVEAHTKRASTYLKPARTKGDR